MRSFIASAFLITASCNPIFGIDEERSIAPADVSQVQILSSAERLPASARNVKLRYRHFQDSILFIRFDAPLKDARGFAERLTGRKLQAGAGAAAMKASTDDWWLKRYPENGEGASGSDSEMNANVVLRPSKDVATVWVFASGG